MQKVKIDRVDLWNGYIEPRRELYVYISNDEDVWRASVPHFVYAESHDKENVFHAIMDQFASMWKMYALQDDDKLTKAARMLKQDLLDTFKEVGCERP